jgi:hypothetical protein
MRISALEQLSRSTERQRWAQLSLADRGTELLDAEVEELIRCYTSVLSVRSSAYAT